MGMAHRGRLNVLANLLQKSFQFIFEEFSENYVPDTVGGDGDVKYHLGYDAVLDTRSGRKVESPSGRESLAPRGRRPGRCRARPAPASASGGDAERRHILPLLVHGDAAFAGQGTVAEVLNYSQLPGYRTGGTVHLVINNQIGFTTLPVEARSSRYCTDVAKMIEAPIFHVNGDDPEAVCYVAGLALDFRQRFQRDVVDRHGLLPPPRAQRIGRTRVHPGPALSRDRRASAAVGDSQPEADRRRHDHRRRIRGHQDRIHDGAGGGPRPRAQEARPPDRRCETLRGLHRGLPARRPSSPRRPPPSRPDWSRPACAA